MMRTPTPAGRIQDTLLVLTAAVPNVKSLRVLVWPVRVTLSLFGVGRII